MQNKVLDKSFFKKDAFFVAENLLGKYLVRRYRKKEIALKINEVEIYDGFEDKASHASKGKTKRNAPMFNEGGVFYVYLIYGMYDMLNVVCGKKGHPSAILIRGAGKLNGPGKLTKFLKINRSFNGKKIKKKTKLWIEDRGEVVSKKDIKKTPRIGVGYAGEIWSKKLLRYVLEKE